MVAVITAALWVFLFHWEDPKIINYTVALLPVVLSISLALIPDLPRVHMIGRLAIVLIGVLWSVDDLPQ